MNTKSTHTQQCELIIRNTQRHTVPTKKREWNHQSARAVKPSTRKQISPSQMRFKLRNQNQFRFSNFVRWKYTLTSSSSCSCSSSVASAWMFLRELEDAIESKRFTECLSPLPKSNNSIHSPMRSKHHNHPWDLIVNQSNPYLIFNNNKIKLLFCPLNYQ